MATVWVREETEETVMEPWEDHSGATWKEYGVLVWIRRGFRWVAIDEAELLPGQYYVTDAPTEWLTLPLPPVEAYTPRRRRAKASVTAGEVAVPEAPAGQEGP